MKNFLTKCGKYIENVSVLVGKLSMITRPESIAELILKRLKLSPIAHEVPAWFNKTSTTTSKAHVVIASRETTSGKSIRIFKNTFQLCAVFECHLFYTVLPENKSFRNSSFFK